MEWRQAAARQALLVPPRTPAQGPRLMLWGLVQDRASLYCFTSVLGTESHWQQTIDLNLEGVLPPWQHCRSASFLWGLEMCFWYLWDHSEGQWQAGAAGTQDIQGFWEWRGLFCFLHRWCFPRLWTASSKLVPRRICLHPIRRWGLRVGLSTQLLSLRKGRGHFVEPPV